MDTQQFRTLVLNGEPGTGDLITFLLEPMGYVIRSARNAQEAIDIARSEEFDVIMIDTLPGDDENGMPDTVYSAATRQAAVIFNRDADPFCFLESQAYRTGGDPAIRRRILDDILAAIHQAVNKPDAKGSA